MNNRVLRFFQRPAGVYHGSIFYSLSGGVGPMSLTLDNAGNLYVGQFDVKGMHFPYARLFVCMSDFH